MHNIVCWIVATVDCQQDLGLPGLGMVMCRVCTLGQTCFMLNRNPELANVSHISEGKIIWRLSKPKLLFLDGEQDNYSTCPWRETVKGCLGVTISSIQTILDALRDCSASSDAQFRDQKGGCDQNFAQRFLYKPQCLLEVQSSPWKHTCSLYSFCVLNNLSY